MYTPTNWATGDTITAEKMNNIEGGLSSIKNATVKVSTEGLISSFVIGYGYIKYLEDRHIWSIDSPYIKFDGFIALSGFEKVDIIDLPQDPTGEYKTCLILSEYWYNNTYVSEATGDLEEPVVAYEHIANEEWSSTPWHCFVVNGNGSIKFALT